MLVMELLALKKEEQLLAMEFHRECNSIGIAQAGISLNNSSRLLQQK